MIPRNDLYYLRKVFFESSLLRNNLQNGTGGNVKFYHKLEILNFIAEQKCIFKCILLSILSFWHTLEDYPTKSLNFQISG